MAKSTRRRRPRYRVFLSHSHEDRWICSVLKEKIEERGVDIWLDAFDIPGGGDIKERIKDGIETCQECLVLISPPALLSWWVGFELGYAEKVGKNVTPLLLHVVPERLGPAQDLRALSINDFELYLHQVVERAAK